MASFWCFVALFIPSVILNTSVFWITLVFPTILFLYELYVDFEMTKLQWEKDNKPVVDSELEKLLLEKEKVAVKSSIEAINRQINLSDGIKAPVTPKEWKGQW